MDKQNSEGSHTRKNKRKQKFPSQIPKTPHFSNPFPHQAENIYTHIINKILPKSENSQTLSKPHLIKPCFTSPGRCKTHLIVSEYPRCAGVGSGFSRLGGRGVHIMVVRPCQGKTPPIRTHSHDQPLRGKPHLKPIPDGEVLKESMRKV